MSARAGPRSALERTSHTLSHETIENPLPAVPSRRPAVRTALSLLCVALAAPAFGCSRVAESVSDPCLFVREEFDYASNRLTGLSRRGIPAGHPTEQLAQAEVRRIRESMVACETRNAG